MLDRKEAIDYDGKQWPLSMVMEKDYSKPLPPTPLQRGSVVMSPGWRWQTGPRKGGITVTETISVVSLKSRMNMEVMEKERIDRNERSYMNFD